MSRWDHLRGGGDPEDDDAHEDPRRLAALIIQKRRATVATGDSVDPIQVDHGDDAVARITLSKNWKDD